LKELEGNPGKRRLNTAELRPPAPAAVPYAPKFVNVDAKREWNRMVGILLELGLYTEVDHAALAMYCQAWGRWVVAERTLAIEGEIVTTVKGGLSQNPWRYEANKAFAQMRQMLPEFGLTPSSRSRMSAPSAPDQPSLAEELFSMVGGDVKVDEDENKI
jgi:P27 family predicted phage terminase small subunit